MAKTNETEQERNEQEFHKTLNIASSERLAELKQELEAAAVKAKKAVMREKRKRALREVCRCGVALAGIVAVGLAESAELIAPVLATPILTLTLIYIGWHLCKLYGCK